jgi:hypothetical protein
MSDFKNQLLSVLNEIKGSGSFVSTNSMPFVFPGLEIAGVGEIGYPINTLEINEMIKVAHKAPFGKGMDTIVDVAVRSAWEIDASQMTFKNDDWDIFIKNIIKKIKPDLGIDQYAVSASPYKLLIYEEGDFFLPHKDSEKEKGMFGTLVIGLPSKFTGGELIIEFDGRKETIDFSEPTSRYKIPFAAFYADCTHELKPITSGYRICLVYNLLQHKVQEEIHLNEIGVMSNRLATILKTCENDPDIPKIILLGHQYTPSNFTMQALKLNDRPKAEALLLAAEKAGFYAKLGLVTSYQAGELEIDYSSRSSRSRYNSYDDDFGNHDNDELAERGTLGDVYDERIDIEHWMQEGVPPLRNISFDEENIVSAIKLNEGDPIEKEAEGYTGNAGMEMIYWYHYGAVFLWPRKYHFKMLNSLSPDNKLEWLAYYNEHWNSISEDEHVLIKKLVEEGLGCGISRGDSDYSPLANWLINLKDEKYLAKNGLVWLANYFQHIAVQDWVKMLETYPTACFEPLFTASGQIGQLLMVKHLLAILNELNATSHYFIDFVISQTDRIPVYLTGVNLSNKREKAFAIDILRGVINLSKLKVGDHVWLEKVTAAFTQVLTREYVNDVLVDLVLQSANELPLVAQIVTICKEDLMRRINSKPLPPADWSKSLPESSSSNYKKVWALLADFLRSPTEQIFDYKKAQAERTEIENAIINVKIDIRTETIRKGMPHTLRLIKTQYAYENELAKWETDVLLLKKVNEF